jgi:hypothetical protein
MSYFHWSSFTKRWAVAGRNELDNQGVSDFAGIGLGAFVGLALGISSGLGTYIHIPIPQALAWGWADRWLAERYRSRNYRRSANQTIVRTR